MVMLCVYCKAAFAVVGVCVQFVVSYASFLYSVCDCCLTACDDVLVWP